MTVSYTAVLTAKDQVRLEIGDTDIATNALLQDEEITYYLTEEGNVVLRAAARAAGAIASKFARLVSLSAGGTSVQLQQQFEHYRQLATDLRERAETESGTAVPYAGGISVADVLANEVDTDRVTPFFGRTTGTPDAAAYRTQDAWGR